MTRPSNSPRQMRLGLFVQPLGHHVSGWRLTQRLGSPTDIDWLISIAKKAEEGTFDMFSSAMRWRPTCTVCRPPWHALSR
jgi:hypothetical protein